MPKKTEVSKQLPKKAIYEKFGLNTKEKQRIDNDISRISIINEIYEGNTNIKMSEDTKVIYVLKVVLKQQKFADKTIERISKMIDQKIIMVLEYNEKIKAAVYYTKLLQTEWGNEKDLQIQLKGLDMQSVWENIVMQIGGIQVIKEDTLEEQIIYNENQEKMQKKIEQLEKRARSERQPRKKFEIVEMIKAMKEEVVKNNGC